ncbi:coxsackievirus and adenovirus receptor homolog [Cyprinus carpio]|uniref:Coxsackievirus and adenovirus receptor homolog n=1 Tax=Cyprinus carpio TaxID=7962 RepID=A0A9Q9WNS4_CYPCA|nr:coxsackievirus and adenovirus receptor homolog [Cyprinus carpio]
MSKFWFNSPLPLAALYITAVCLNHAALAVQVTSTGPQTVKKAQDESVTLGCTYSLDPADIGDLDIEWTRVSQDMTQKDELILSYTGGKQFQLGSPDLMSRFKFVGDPSRGDATVSISSVKVSDTATYQCKVKKTPGIDSRKVTIVVLGEDMLILSVFYLNLLSLATNKAGVIAGAVIGALLLLLLLLLLIWLLICCCNKRRYEKEVANEIREDAAAPESRPGSRNSSFRSILNYRVHSGIHYSSVGKADVTRVESGRSSTHTERGRVQREASMPASDHRPPLRYDSRYGYPV